MLEVIDKLGDLGALSSPPRPVAARAGWRRRGGHRRAPPPTEEFKREAREALLAVGSSLQNLGNATSSSSETSGGSSERAAAPIPTLTPATASVLISAAALALRRCAEATKKRALATWAPKRAPARRPGAGAVGVVNSVTEAADFLGTIFKASASVDRTSAVVATATISSLIGEAATVADTATVDENEGVASAAKALQGAVEGLGTAALAGMEGDSKPLVLKSPDLNMTVEARPAPRAADRATRWERGVERGVRPRAGADVGGRWRAAVRLRLQLHGMGDLGASGGGTEAGPSLLASGGSELGAWARAARPPGLPRPGRGAAGAPRRLAGGWSRHRSSWRLPGAAAPSPPEPPSPPPIPPRPPLVARSRRHRRARPPSPPPTPPAFAGAVAAAAATAAVAADAVAAATLAAARPRPRRRRWPSLAPAVRRGAAVPVRDALVDVSSEGCRSTAAAARSCARRDRDRLHGDRRAKTWEEFEEYAAGPRDQHVLGRGGVPRQPELGALCLYAW